jgi:hypothetical protein
MKLKSNHLLFQGHFLAVMLALAVLLSLRPVLGGEFVWDDRIILIGNSNYRGLGWPHIEWMFTTYLDGNYHPLSWLTFGVDYVLWGMNPAGYHATSLLLHICNTLLVYYTLYVFFDLIKLPGLSDRTHVLPVSAFVGALFFGIHPLRAETVGWLSARGDLVCCFFYLLTVIAYLKYACSADLRGPQGWLYISILFFALSLLGRAWGITLPVVLLILDAYPLRRITGISKKTGWVLIEKVPFALLSLLGAWLAISAKLAGGQIVSLNNHGLVARMAQALYGLCFYPVKTLLPLGLSPLYLLEKDFDPISPRFYICLFSIVLGTAVLVIYRRRLPWAIAACLAYVVIISPQLGIVQSGPQIAADRYSYIATLPFSVLVGAGTVRLLVGRLSKAVTRLALMGIIFIVVTFSVLSYAQSQIWHDRSTLWNHVIGLNPNNDIAYYNLGVYLLKSGDYDLAIKNLTESSRLNPESAKPHNQLGVIYMIQGDNVLALRQFNQALSLNQAYPEAYANRGLLRYKTGDKIGAINDYATALGITKTAWRYRAKVEGLMYKVKSEATHHITEAYGDIN